MLNVLENRFFYSHSNRIYKGGISGFKDLGPLGLRLKKALLSEWNDHFVKEDNLFEIESAILTSDLVLQASGHADKFNDSLFETKVGKNKMITAYLRPETAQGIFVNFFDLAKMNRNSLPFGVAQVGKSFRNEIDPRGNLFRLREFTQAEIEYFFSPHDKTHPKFDSIKDIKVKIATSMDQNSQESDIDYHEVSIDFAVENGMVLNKILAYYIAKIHLFMEKVGIDLHKMRFRQQKSDELAHYAADSWDCECLTECGWVECIGLSDRSAFDLTQHSIHSNFDLCINNVKDKKIVPHVIEPSFGIDRIMHSIFSHNFKYRKTNNRKSFFTFKPSIAPIQCDVLPIVNNNDLCKESSRLLKKLRQNNIRVGWIQDKGSLGSRYIRSDEIGVPYLLVVDTENLAQDLICIRERNSRESIKVDRLEVVETVTNLINGSIDWEQAKSNRVLNSLEPND